MMQPNLTMLIAQWIELLAHCPKDPSLNPTLCLPKENNAQLGPLYTGAQS